MRSFSNSFSVLPTRLVRCNRAGVRVGLLLFTVLISTCLSIVGCDTSVEVVRESDQRRYSLYGVLNVAADTQFIRVEPLGDTTQIGAPRDIEATVILENLDDKNEIVLRDSFATIQSDASPPRSAQVHVFWTTHPVRAGTSYRLRVEEEGQAVTSAKTRTPSQPPNLSQQGKFYLPCCFESSSFSSRSVCPTKFTVEARHEHRIAAARVTYPFGKRPFPTVNLSDTIRSSIHYAGASIPISYRADLVKLHQQRDALASGCPSLSELETDTARVMVAAGGPDWPDLRGIPSEERYQPGAASNVTGGLGFVGGIFSDTLDVAIKARPRPFMCACAQSPASTSSVSRMGPPGLWASRRQSCRSPVGEAPLR